ncbi:MAG TPA: hypothetical protein VFJ04_02900 [Rhodanobacteraceae bacterium]|jgi:hypothetical protein|nr:hypothetical protein [Rhodanobacteraceae bacterium]
MRTRNLLVCLLFACASAGTALAANPPGQAPAQPVMTPVPAAAPADVQSIDAIVGALYDVISGPVGKARDWKRMRSLFVPGGRLMAVVPRRDGAGGMGLYVLSVNDYIAISGPLLEKTGFHERELARRTDRFGHIAQVFSTYEGRMDSDPAKPMRGINSIELMNDGTRWWVVSVYWEDERADNPLPPAYLPRS